MLLEERHKLWFWWKEKGGGGGGGGLAVTRKQNDTETQIGTLSNHRITKHCLYHHNCHYPTQR